MEQKNIQTFHKFQSLPFENVFVKCTYCYLRILIWDQNQVPSFCHFVPPLPSPGVISRCSDGIGNMRLHKLSDSSLSQAFSTIFKRPCYEENKCYFKPYQSCLFSKLVIISSLAFAFVLLIFFHFLIVMEVAIVGLFWNMVVVEIQKRNYKMIKI